MASIPTWKKNSVLFLLSQTISQFGTAIVQYSIFWYITLSTKSGMILTLTIIVGLLPTFLLSPLAGVFADRYSKKKMIMISDGLIALVTLVLAVVFFNGYESLVLLLFITLIRAIGVGIQNPASSSLVPEFVPKEKLSSFNGVLTGTLSLMNIISPAVSGLLLNILSFDQILLIDVITAVIGISLFYFIKVPGGRKEKSESYISDVKAGIGYIRKNSFLILLFVYLAAHYFLATPEAFLTVLQVVRNYGDEVYRLSAIEIAFFLGMFFGGLTIIRFKGFKNRLHTLVATIFILGVASLALTLPLRFGFYVVVIFLIGLMVAFFNTSATVFLQEKIDPAYQGRIFGIYTTLYNLMFPLGLMIFGPLADVVEIEVLLGITGILMLFLGIFFSRSKSLLAYGDKEIL